MTYGCITDLIPEDGFYMRYEPLVTAVTLCEKERAMSAYLRAFDNDDDECEDKWEEYGL